MEMVVHQRPGEAIGAGLLKQFPQAQDKRLSIFIVEKDIALLYPSDDDVLQDTWDVNAGGAWHGKKIAGLMELVN